MTREEAINHIKTVAKSAVDSGYDSAIVDAVSMTKEALEQEPKYCDRNICIQNEYNGIGCGECEVTKSQEPCEDVISRQAVLDGLASIAKAKARSDAQESLMGRVIFFTEHLPPVTPQPKIKMERCKDCKYFEYNSVAKIDGVPLIVAHEICSKWGSGCKTREDGYCFLFEPRGSEEQA